MSKFFSLLSMIVVFGLLSVSESQAQLPKGSAGIGTNFSNGTPGLSIAYAFSETFDLNFVLGYNMSASSTERDGEEVSSSDASQVNLGLSGRIFIDDNDAVDPFIGFGFSYADHAFGGVGTPGGSDVSAIGVTLLFGGQSELATNFFVYAGTGLTYISASGESGETVSTNSVLSLGTTSIGAIFYF